MGFQLGRCDPNTKKRWVSIEITDKESVVVCCIYLSTKDYGTDKNSYIMNPDFIREQSIAQIINLTTLNASFEAVNRTVIDSFVSSAAVIEYAVQNKGKGNILVHCNLGKERTLIVFGCYLAFYLNPDFASFQENVAGIFKLFKSIFDVREMRATSSNDSFNDWLLRIGGLGEKKSRKRRCSGTELGEYIRSGEGSPKEWLRCRSLIIEADTSVIERLQQSHSLHRESDIAAIPEQKEEKGIEKQSVKEKGKEKVCESDKTEKQSSQRIESTSEGASDTVLTVCTYIVPGNGISPRDSLLSSSSPTTTTTASSSSSPSLSSSKGNEEK